MSDVGWWKGLDCSAAQNSKIKVPGMSSETLSWRLYAKGSTMMELHGDCDGTEKRHKVQKMYLTITFSSQEGLPSAVFISVVHSVVIVQSSCTQSKTAQYFILSKTRDQFWTKFKTYIVDMVHKHMYLAMFISGHTSQTNQVCVIVVQYTFEFGLFIHRHNQQSRDWRDH